MLFYDFECFKYNWMVVFIDPSERKETVIIDDVDKFKAFYEEHKKDIWVSYNGRNYDQYLAKGILCGFNPYDISKFIIEKRHPGWMYSSLLRQFPLLNYDCMTSFHSLKTLEGFMGNDIQETSVSFDLDRPLTAAEIEQTIFYCRHDVQQTIEVFLSRIDDFNAHMNIIKSFKLPIQYVSKSRGQLIASILGATRREYNDEFDISIPDTLVLNKYAYVRDWYLDKNNHNYDKNTKLDTEIAGIPHTFKWGGVHGALKGYAGRGNYIMIDVASLYPSLMIEYGYFSRSVRSPQKYIDIYHENLEMKKNKDPRRPAYKLVCNTTYGCFKESKSNALYDPLMANNICIAGQLLLLDLIEKLEPWCTILQSNTDGILIEIGQTPLEIVKKIVSEWEKRTRLTMEYTFYTELYQGDVNNYLIIDKDGHYKSKGAYVKEQSKLDYDLPIVNKAIVNYLTRRIHPKDTIESCNELKEFQKVVSVSAKYGFAVWNGKRMNEKAFRVFASLRDTDGMIGKCKKDGATVEKFALTPEYCFIMNGDINGVACPEYLDKSWYLDLTLARLNDKFNVAITMW